jgi:hypothetical protein
MARAVHLWRDADPKLPAEAAVGERPYGRFAVGLHVGHDLRHQLADAGERGLRCAREPGERGELGAQRNICAVLRGPGDAIGELAGVHAHAWRCDAAMIAQVAAAAEICAVER